jgi:NAD-reducing hydrogenase large subunit
MASQILIDPVTRIEGHAKITIFLDDDGGVKDAQFHVTQVRGFEKFCEGRPYTEMPSLMARICGICPVSHLMASAKACDALLAVRIPKTGANLRRIMNLGQIIQSHALSFFHLSSPDFIIGWDADPKVRNIVGVAQQSPQMALDGIRLRKFGQQVIEILGVKRVHPAWVVPGGVNEPLNQEKKDTILSQIPEMKAITHRTLAWFKNNIGNHRDEISTFANFPTMFMGLVTDEGGLEHYDGKLRFVDASGRKVQEDIEPARYMDYIGEAVEPYSYLKFPYYLPVGYPDGIYRVGPLARLNISDKCGTPEADQELAEFRNLDRGVPMSSFYFHYARLIEILFGLETIEQLLNDPDILSPRVRAFAGPNASEGVGVSEAPRGTLMHHYKIDDDGLITWANLIIATGHNNMAMNRGVTQVAKRFVNGKNLHEGMLNRVEAVIRCYDPCLSCSTHADGRMAMDVSLVDAGGALVDRITRD